VSYLYIINTFSRNRGKSAGIEKGGAHGDITELVHYWGPSEGTTQVYRSRFGHGQFMFWAENDNEAFETLRRELPGKFISGKSYLRSCRVTVDRVREIEAAYAECSCQEKEPEPEPVLTAEDLGSWQGRQFITATNLTELLREVRRVKQEAKAKGCFAVVWKIGEPGRFLVDCVKGA
jgi:hypothetical protein